jgi:hypothetical protein
MVILATMDLRYIGWEDVEWISLAQDMGQWWTYHLHVLFEFLFCLTKLLNMMTEQNFETILGQTLNDSV